jgi:NodT family efflux transporter outer membrane factor (OMF) lipoprotein
MRLWIVCAGLAGCAVGPDYKGPPAPPETGATFKRAGSEVESEEPAAHWWADLKDPELGRLMDAALSANPSIEVARARLREARATLAQQRANERPNTGTSAAYIRMRNLSTLVGAQPGGGAGAGGGDLDLYSLGFDATWEIDIFGAKRRAAEGAAAAAQGSRARLADVLVSLSAEVAQAYIELRDAQQRLALTERNVAIEAQLLDLMQVRRTGGTASDLDVDRAVNQLESTRSGLGAIHTQIAQQLDRLATLTGRPPGSLDAELAESQPVPPPPEKIDVGDPGSLLRRRPDIAVAERTLAQQNAAIGENVAALFPKVTLLGDVGFAALTPRSLFDGSSFTYVMAPVLQWTPWDFGRTKAKIDQARAGRDEAEADYRRTVLAALEDAETSLAQYGEQRSTVSGLGRARDSAVRVYDLTEVRLRGGTASSSDVLQAETRRVQAELDYESALAQLSEYFVALQKSLGLGWVDSAAG